MSSFLDTAQVLRWTTRSAVADFRATYTWRSYVFAWLLRILAQVLFYGLIGVALGDPGAIEYLVVGNAVFVGVTVCLAITASSTWERRAGTIPLSIAAPTPLVVVVAGRSVQWIVDGLIVSSVSLFVLAPLLKVQIDVFDAVLCLPVLALINVSAYGLGLCLAGVTLRFPSFRNGVSALAGLALAIACGVQVPASFWPAPVGFVGQFLPLSHGLQAVRSLVAGERGLAPMSQIGLELLVGASWWVLGVLVFAFVVRRVRSNGMTLD